MNTASKKFGIITAIAKMFCRGFDDELIIYALLQTVIWTILFILFGTAI